MGNNRQKSLGLEPGTQFWGQEDKERSVQASEGQWSMRGGEKQTNKQKAEDLGVPEVIHKNGHCIGGHEIPWRPGEQQ